MPNLLSPDPGATRVPTAEVTAGAHGLPEPGTAVVTYCWGPGCDGATRSTLAFARRGYPVREMIGGIEYWIREGFAVQAATGSLCRPADPLVARAGGMGCTC
jgi:rhodanese-related sulfurtransferase